jgi:hypothetical protein
MSLEQCRTIEMFVRRSKLTTRLHHFPIWSHELEVWMSLFTIFKRFVFGDFCGLQRRESVRSLPDLAGAPLRSMT